MPKQEKVLVIYDMVPEEIRFYVIPVTSKNRKFLETAERAHERFGNTRSHGRYSRNHSLDLRSRVQGRVQGGRTSRDWKVGPFPSVRQGPPRERTISEGLFDGVYPLDPEAPRLQHVIEEP